MCKHSKENITALKSVIKKEKPDIIFHLAAQPLVLESYKKPKSTFFTNMMGTVNLLESIREISTEVPIVIITSDKVYSTSIYKKYKENDKLGGIEKKDGEENISNLNPTNETGTTSSFEELIANIGLSL